MRSTFRIATVLAVLLAVTAPAAASAATGVSQWGEGEMGGYNGEEGYTIVAPSLEWLCGGDGDTEALEHVVLAPSDIVIVQSSTVGPKPIEVYETPQGEDAVDAWVEEQCEAIASGALPERPIMTGEATARLNLRIDQDSVEYRVIVHGTVVGGDGAEHALDSVFKQVVTFPDDGPPIVNTLIDKVRLRSV